MWTEEETCSLRAHFALELQCDGSESFGLLAKCVASSECIVDWNAVQSVVGSKTKEECYRKVVEEVDQYIPLGVIYLFKCDASVPKVIHVTFEMTFGDIREHARQHLETLGGVVLQIEEEGRAVLIREDDDSLIITDHFRIEERIHCHKVFSSSTEGTSVNKECSTIDVETPNQVLHVPRFANMRVCDLLEAIIKGDPLLGMLSVDEKNRIVMSHRYHGLLFDGHESISRFDPPMDYVHIAIRNKKRAAFLQKQIKLKSAEQENDVLSDGDESHMDTANENEGKRRSKRRQQKSCSESRKRKRMEDALNSSLECGQVDEDVVDDELKSQCCCNCGRTAPVDCFDPQPVCYMFKITVVDLNHLLVRDRRREFCEIDFARYQREADGSRPAPICGNCYSHLSEPSGTVSGAASYWPVFIWKLLTDESIGSRAWSLLPTMFRKWWIRSFSVLTNTKKSALMSRECHFEEVTFDMNADISSLKSLRWGEDLLPRELSLTLPVVKCPAGCSEWKHRTQSLPMDVVFEFVLDQELSLYSKKNKRHCKRWFRGDYLKKESLYLNPNWICQPSIGFCKETGAPTVLCCRDHSSTKTTSMLHPCRHASVPVSTEKAGQFAPVISCPRTIRKACYSKYSASFHVARMEGCFNGLDTMSLVADGGWHHYQQKLAWDQEVLAVNGRKDLKAHVCKLSYNNKIAKNLAASLIESKDYLYPDWSTVVESSTAGGTYVSVDDTMRMHQNMFYDRNESCLCRNTRTNKQKWVQFRGTWPRHLTHIQRASSHGAEPLLLPSFKRQMENKDARTLWIVYSAVLFVPELWHEIAKTKKVNTELEGWLLALITRCSMPWVKMPGSSNNPFKKSLSVKEIYARHFEKNFGQQYVPCTLLFDFFQFGSLEERSQREKVDVMWDRFDEPIDESVTVCVVIRDEKEVARKRRRRIRMLWNPESEIGNWELRYVAISKEAERGNPRHQWRGQIYLRHGNVNGSSWWWIPSNADLPRKKSIDFEIEDLNVECKSWFNSWNMCVYVKKSSFTDEKIRSELLKSCFGQSVYFCSNHNCALITVASKLDDSQCCLAGNNGSACGNRVKWVCPTDDCKAAVCNTHSSEDDAKIFISPMEAVEAEGSDASMSSVDNFDTDTVEDSQECSDSLPLVDGPSGQKLRGIQVDLSSDDPIAKQNAENEMEVLRENAFICSLPNDSQLWNYDNVETGNEADMTEDIVQCVPTTDSGLEPTHFDLNDCDYKGAHMSNHALLNVFGSCLIRKRDNISGTLKQQAFLQRQISQSPGRSYPLIYTEGAIHSDIFPFDMNDGSVIGALPFSMLTSDYVLMRNGFSNLHDTFRTRMKNPALLASCNPKYHFWAFDALANFSLRGHDTRIVLRRGFAESLSDTGVRMRDDKHPIFTGSHVESRSIVNELSFSIGAKFPTYFYTHTCSMKTHFGMRLVWKWLQSEEIIKNNCKEECAREIEHWKKSLLDSSGAMLLRLWMEMLNVWILYITKSPEKPMGNVTGHWSRFELQDPKAIGNLPHMHTSIWTDDDLKTTKGLHTACDRIRGFVEDFVRPDEKKVYFEKKVFTSQHEFAEFKELLQRILPHQHKRRCYIVCRSSGNKLTLRCKAKDNWKNSKSKGEHSFRQIPVNHTQDAIRIMQRIGVAAKQNGVITGEGKSDDLQFIPLVDWLEATEHIPPSHGDEGIISPVIGALIAVNQNCDNCQLTNSYFISRYLSKYIAKIDEYGRIYVSPPGDMDKPNEFSVQGDTNLNTKITSNNFERTKGSKEKKTLTAKRTTAIPINVADVYMKYFDYPTIVTNLRTVKISTSPYDSRSCTERKRGKPILKWTNHYAGTAQANALTELNTLPAHHARLSKGLTGWRQFMSTQVSKLFDDLHSPLNCDSVTKFGFRPPELRFVMHQSNYFRWFTFHVPEDEQRRCITSIQDTIEFCTKHTGSFQNVIETTWWIAGNFKVVKLRPSALNEVLLYLETAPLDVFSSEYDQAIRAKTLTMALFHDLWTYHQHLHLGKALHDLIHVPAEFSTSDTAATAFLAEKCQHLKTIHQRFIDDTETHLSLPTIWFNPVKPNQPNRFLIHLLLSCGCFVDEYDLFATGSLRQSFIKARMLDENRLEASITKVMKVYFTNQLKHLPSGTPTFDRHCSAAFKTIEAFFRDGEMYTDELPCVLYNRLVRETSVRVKRYMESKATVFMEHALRKLRECGFSNVPDINCLMEATLEKPYPWDCSNVERPEGQPEASHHEQMNALGKLKQMIDNFCRITPSRSCPKSFCLVGAGGVGKTTCALIAMVYARCCGLRVHGTALVSERAQELGVEHLNQSMCVPAVDFTETSAGQLAEQIVSSLHRHPEKLELWRTLDINLFDELGPVSAELWSAREIALRYIRQSSKPNGGLLEICTFDHLQMHPIQGTHPLLSPLLTSGHRFTRLTECVRGCQSEPWLQLQSMTRMTAAELDNPLNEELFMNLFVNNCSFVEDASEVPIDALFVYGKNHPIKEECNRVHERVRQKPNVVVSKSNDFERNSQGRYIPATKFTTGTLNWKLREHSEVFFYEKARYRITYNKHNCFSNGQLAFLPWKPDFDAISNKKPVTLMIAPAGSTYIPNENDDEETLAQRMWKKEKIGIAPDATVYQRGTRMKRTSQYGLQLYVASTFHSTMGKTLIKLATRVDEMNDPHSPYSIWDPTQVVILFSRTKLPSDTYFVTKNPKATGKAIYKVLKKKSAFRAHLTDLLNRLCGNGRDIAPLVLDNSTCLFCPPDVPVPNDSSGFVCILVSTVDTNHVYTGSCRCLHTRFRQHNSGHGASQTSNSSLRPWALLGFVSGFEGDDHIRLQFENRWIREKMNLIGSPAGRHATVEDILNLVHPLKEHYNSREDINIELVFTDSGTFRILESADV